MIYSKKIKLVLTTIAATAAMMCTTGAFAADVTCTTSTNVRSGPGNAYSVITTMDAGTVTQDLGQTGGWTKVTANGKTGYVYSRYLTDSSLTPSYEEPSNDTYTAVFGSNVISVAQSLLGRPYVSGASGPNAFDCSGFTSYVYSCCGKSIPRTSAEQYANSQHISKSELQPGDLVFFTGSSPRSGIGHAAIYLGNGQIIHAANAKTGVCITNMYNSYYGPRYIGSGRY